MSELSPAIINWINRIPLSDQEVFDDIDCKEMMLIHWLREGKDIKRLRELFSKLADELDEDDQIADA